MTTSLPNKNKYLSQAIPSKEISADDLLVGPKYKNIKKEDYIKPFKLPTRPNFTPVTDAGKTIVIDGKTKTILDAKFIAEVNRIYNDFYIVERDLKKAYNDNIELFDTNTIESIYEKIINNTPKEEELEYPVLIKGNEYYTIKYAEKVDYAVIYYQNILDTLYDDAYSYRTRCKYMDDFFIKGYEKIKAYIETLSDEIKTNFDKSVGTNIEFEIYKETYYNSACKFIIDNGLYDKNVLNLIIPPEYFLENDIINIIKESIKKYIKDQTLVEEIFNKSLTENDNNDWDKAGRYLKNVFDATKDKDGFNALYKITNDAMMALTKFTNKLYADFPELLFSIEGIKLDSDEAKADKKLTRKIEHFYKWYSISCNRALSIISSPRIILIDNIILNSGRFRGFNNINDDEIYGFTLLLIGQILAKEDLLNLSFKTDTDDVSITDDDILSQNKQSLVELGDLRKNYFVSKIDYEKTVQVLNEIDLNSDVDPEVRKDKLNDTINAYLAMINSISRLDKFEKQFENHEPYKLHSDKMLLEARSGRFDELKYFKEKLDESKEKINTLDDKLKTITDELENSKKELSSVNENLETFKVENEKLINDNKEALDTINNLNKDLLTKENDLTTSKEKCAELSAANEAKIKSLEENIKTIEENKEKLNSKIADNEKTINQLEVEKGKLEDEKITSDLDKLTLENDLKSVNDKLEKAKVDLDKNQTLLEESDKALTKAKTDAETAKEESDKKLAEAEANYKAKVDEVEQIKINIQKAEETIAQADKLILEAYTSLETEKNKLENDIKKSDDALKAKQDELDTSNTRIKELENLLLSNTEKSKKELDEATVKLEESNKALEDSKLEVEAVKKEAQLAKEEADAKLKEFADKVKLDETKLNEYESTITNNKVKLEDYEDKLSKQNDTTAKLTEDLAKTNQQKDELIKAKEDISKHLEDTVKTLSTVKEEANKLDNELKSLKAVEEQCIANSKETNAKLEDALYNLKRAEEDAKKLKEETDVTSSEYLEKIKNYENDINKHKLDVDTITGELNNLKKVENTLREDKLNLSKQIQDTNNKLNEHTTQLTESRKKLTETEDELKKATSDIASYQKSIETFKQEKEKLTEDIGIIKDTLSKTKEELETFKNKATEAMEGSKKDKEEVLQIKAELDEALDKLDEAEDKVKESDIKLKKSKKALANANKEVQLAKEQLSEMEHLAIMQEQAIEKAFNQIREDSIKAHEELDTTKETLSKTLLNLKLTTEERDALTSKLELSEKDKKILQDNIGILNTLQDKLEDIIKDRDDSLKIATNKHNEDLELITKISDENTKLKFEVKKLKDLLNLGDAESSEFNTSKIIYCGEYNTLKKTANLINGIKDAYTKYDGNQLSNAELNAATYNFHIEFNNIIFNLFKNKVNLTPIFAGLIKIFKDNYNVLVRNELQYGIGKLLNNKSDVDFYIFVFNILLTASKHQNVNIVNVLTKWKSQSDKYDKATNFIHSFFIDNTFYDYTFNNESFLEYYKS